MFFKVFTIIIIYLLAVVMGFGVILLRYEKIFEEIPRDEGVIFVVLSMVLSLVVSIYIFILSYG